MLHARRLLNEIRLLLLLQKFNSFLENFISFRLSDQLFLNAGWQRGELFAIFS